MRWRDIEDGAWWVVPAEVAMNGEANRVPLSAQVRRILDELRPETGDGDFVIASPYKRGVDRRAPTILKDSSKATMPSHPGSMHGPLTCDCMETTSPSMLN